MSEALIDILIVALIVVPIFPLSTVAVLAWHTPWRAGSPSLSERTLLAVRDASVAVVVAALAANRVFGWEWDRAVVLLLTTTILLLVSLPSAYWLLLYSRGGFR